MDITGISAVAGFGEKIVDFIQGMFPAKMNDAEKAQVQLGVQKLAQEFKTSTIAAQRDIIVAEMQQGDAFTKRARPALVYMGLVFIALNYVAVPVIAWFYIAITGKAISPPTLQLPAEFWWSWTGVCSAWVIGRSYEKGGAANGIIAKAASIITGSK